MWMPIVLNFLVTLNTSPCKQRNPDSTSRMAHLEQGVNKAIGEIAQGAPLVHDFYEVVYEMPYLSPEQVTCSQQGGRADCKGDQAQNALSGGAICVVFAAMPWSSAFCAVPSTCPAAGEEAGSGGPRRKAEKGCPVRSRPGGCCGELHLQKNLLQTVRTHGFFYSPGPERSV